MNRRLFAAFILMLVVMPLFIAQACGPDFYPDVFVIKLRPDHPKEFASGKLGVLLPTYPRADLTVAFRYLNSGNLDATEGAAYQPTYSYHDPEWEKQWNTPDAATGKQEDPAQAWQAIHARYAAATPKVEQERELKVQRPDGEISVSNYQNCNGDAFLRAVSTLQSRAKTWGERSPDLADWLKGQDVVFANCTDRILSLPSAAPAGSSPLLKADRAYQIAAAEFYGTRFEDARKSFEAIAQDSGSSWQGLARYLVARCLVRQAFYAKSSNNGDSAATFDPALMRQAAVLLESLLREKQPGISRRAIQKELDLVRLRIEPTARLRELADALAGPKSDPEYEQHLQDFTWYLDKQLDEKAVREDTSQDALDSSEYHANQFPLSSDATVALFSKTYTQLAGLRSSATLVDWLVTFQSPAQEAREHAFVEWKKTGQLYWLVAAISKASDKDPEVNDLIAAAAQVKPDSPAWESLTYHRARLLIALNRAEEARALLDRIMPQIRATGRDSSANLYLGLRMRASANLKQAMSYAPRKMLGRGSEEQAALDECIDVMKNPKRKYDCKQEMNPTQFSADAAGFFNTQAPLGMLADIAESGELPDQLRRSVAMMAWTRSVLLKDDAIAGKLFPLLPTKLQQEAGTGTGFHALMSILRNPGLRPYLDAGVQRSYSYDFVQSYSDNWWCQASSFAQDETPMRKERAAFLTAEQTKEVERQTSELERQGSAEIFLGGLVLAHANDHPDDTDVPESLYLVLRLIRYGCGRGYWGDASAAKEESQKVTAIQKAASRLLRQRYAASPWTKKSAPFAG
jgi:hypothetical protein